MSIGSNDSQVQNPTTMRAPPREWGKKANTPQKNWARDKKYGICGWWKLAVRMYEFRAVYMISPGEI